MTSHELKIKKTLLDLGITPEIKGYHYLTEAIKIKESANAANNFNKSQTKIYREIAEKFYASISGVERAIRHAIQRSYKSKCPIFFTIFTPAVLDIYKGRITNSCFISMVTEYIASQSIEECEEA